MARPSRRVWRDPRAGRDESLAQTVAKASPLPSHQSDGNFHAARRFQQTATAAGILRRNTQRISAFCQVVRHEEHQLGGLVREDRLVVQLLRQAYAVLEINAYLFGITHHLQLAAFHADTTATGCLSVFGLGLEVDDVVDPWSGRWTRATPYQFEN